MRVYSANVKIGFKILLYDYSFNICIVMHRNITFYESFEALWRCYESKLDGERAAFTHSVNPLTIGAKYRIIPSQLESANVVVFLSLFCLEGSFRFHEWLVCFVSKAERINFSDDILKDKVKIKLFKVS